MASWFACKPCSESDPTQHTVKVDASLFNKENVQPLQCDKDKAEEERERQIEEQKAARRREEEAFAAAAAEALRLGEERAAAERARREEAERREAEELAEAEAQRLAAEKRAREDEAARAAAEAAAAAVQAECRRQQAVNEATAKVNAWCKSNGFQDMNTQKKTLRGATKFPMHTAVKYSNQEIVEMMLLAGIDKDVRDSNKQTPLQLAAKLNKNGSHDQIIAMLRY